MRRLEKENEQDPFAPDDRAYWMLRAHREFSTPGRADRGLLSMLLLNLVRLRPGQALFLPAGELHSYLRGVGIEIMANSNNVLRSGLTTKHVDPEALLQVLTFHAGPAEVLEPPIDSEKPWLAEYETPAAEFALRRLTLDAGQIYPMVKGEMRLALIANGAIDIAAEGPKQLQARQGEALLIPAGLGCRISCTEGTELWLARVPAKTARR